MKFLKGLVLTILVIMLFVSTLGLLILFPIKSAVGKNSIKDLISNLNIEQMVEENPEFEQTINEMFEPIFTETEELGIDEEIIVKIMDSQEVKNLIGDLTSNVVDYVLTGENQKLITTENITDLVTTAIDDINKSGIYEITEKQKTSVVDSVQKYADEFQDLVPDTQVVEESLTAEDQEVLNIIRFVLGDTLITILLVSTLISIAGLVALKFKQARCLKYIAIPTLVSSLIAGFTYVILKIANNMTASAEYLYITDIFNKGINMGMILSFSICALMIIALVVYGITNKRKASSAK